MQTETVAPSWWTLPWSRVLCLIGAERLVLSVAKVGKSDIHRTGAQLISRGLQVSGNSLFFEMSMCPGSQWLMCSVKCFIAHFWTLSCLAGLWITSNQIRSDLAFCSISKINRFLVSILHTFVIHCGISWHLLHNKKFSSSPAQSRRDMTKLPYALNCIISPYVRVPISGFSVDVKSSDSTDGTSEKPIACHGSSELSINWVLDVMSTLTYQKA